MEIRREIFCEGRREGVYKLVCDNGYYWSYIPTVEDALRLNIEKGRNGFHVYGFTIPFMEGDI